MNSVLDFAKVSYVTAQNLMPFLTDYNNPRDFISRLVKSGELIRLKNGFFIKNDSIQNEPIPYEQIGNLIYGPSYISFEWALSYYGLIPEGVYVVTSATSGKNKTFKTPLGNFEYCHLSLPRYSIGIDQCTNATGRFLIARPEKALADVVHQKSKNIEGMELLVDLIEGRRISEEALKGLDKPLLHQIASNYRSKAVTALTNALGLL